MSVFSIAISLSATRHDGASVLHADFLGRLRIPPGSPVDNLECTGEPWRTSRVDFSPVRAKDHPIDTPGVVPFYEAVGIRLGEIAAFLELQEPENFVGIRALGITPYVYVDIWMNQNQFELKLPIQFLTSCSRLGLGVELISNDISADQAREWGAT